MNAVNKYLTEILQITGQLYKDKDVLSVIREFATRSLKFQYGLKGKYEPIKTMMQKEGICKEETYLYVFRNLKKIYPENYKKAMAGFFEKIIIGFIVRGELQSHDKNNPALLDLYLDFRDGIDLSYNEEDILDAIDSNKSREELKIDLEEVIKIYQDKIQEMKIYSKGLNHIKPLLEKELTPEDVSNLDIWSSAWSFFTALDINYQITLTHELVMQIEKYQRATKQNYVKRLKKASESIKSILSDLINRNESGINSYQPEIPEKKRVIGPKVRAKKMTLEMRVEKMLIKGRMSAFNISEALNESTMKVLTVLYDMERDKKARPVGKGELWELSKK